MSDKPESNLYRLHAALRALHKACEGGDRDEARAALAQVDEEDVAHALSPFHEDVGVKITESLGSARIEMEIPGDNWFSAIAADQVDKALTNLTDLLPRFHIVLMNETQNWVNEKFVKAAGKIWAAYLYDDNRRVHIADTSASFELVHLYENTQNQLSEKQQEYLDEGSNGSDPFSYSYCRDVDAIGWDRKQYCGYPTNSDQDTYQEMADAVRQGYDENWQIQLPRPTNVHDFISEAQWQLKEGNPWCARAALKTALTIEWPAHIKKTLESISSLFGSEDPHALECAAEDLAVLGERARLVPGDELSLFNSELFSRPNGLDGIESKQCLVDLMHVQDAILRGGFTSSWADRPQALEVIKEMPSAQRWLQYVNLFDKDGNILPRAGALSVAKAATADALQLSDLVRGTRVITLQGGFGFDAHEKERIISAGSEGVLTYKNMSRDWAVSFGDVLVYIDADELCDPLRFRNAQATKAHASVSERPRDDNASMEP